MDWIRADGSIDHAAFLAHACSVLGDPAERWGVDLDAVAAQIVERPSWHLEAACRGMGTTSFYAPGNTPATRHALTVCAGCTVVHECRAAGVEGDEIGVWGGIRLAPRTHGKRARRWLNPRALLPNSGIPPRPGRCDASGRDGVDEWGDAACNNVPTRGPLCNACAKREYRWKAEHAERLAEATG